MAAQRAWIHAVGMSTALGLSAPAAAAAVAAGISRYRESEALSHTGEPMVLVRAPDEALPPLVDQALDQGLTPRQARAVRLAGLAMAEAAPDGAAVPLFLAAPEPLGEQPGRSLARALAAQSGVALQPAAGQLFGGGSAGGLQALAAAMQALDPRTCPLALVGGADSLLDPELLQDLDRQQRVLAEGVADGFAPGEGAAFVLLGAAPPASGGVAIPAAPGFGQEPGHRGSDQPNLAQGLTAAVASALEGSSAPVATALCDLNGERLEAVEWGAVSIRQGPALAESLRLVHPADCHGDLGAAAAVALLVLAHHGLQQGSIKGPALIWSSRSEQGLRAAVRLEQAPAAAPSEEE